MASDFRHIAHESKLHKCLLGAEASVDPPVRFKRPAKSTPLPTRFLHLSPCQEATLSRVLTFLNAEDMGPLSSHPRLGHAFLEFSDGAAAEAAAKAIMSEFRSWSDGSGKGRTVSDNGVTEPAVEVKASSARPRPIKVQFADASYASPESSLPVCPLHSLHVEVPGLRVISDFISEEEEKGLLAALDADGGSQWRESISRRVQHYGFAFDYITRNVDASKPIVGGLPGFCEDLVRKLQREVGFTPDQLTVNEYLPSQGIGMHVDTHSAFGDILVSLSLAAPCVMRLRDADNPSIEKGVVLPRRSLLVLSGPARFKWEHGIVSRKSDVIDCAVVSRERRVSLTLRTVRVGSCACAFPKHCDSQGAQLKQSTVLEAKAQTQQQR